MRLLVYGLIVLSALGLVLLEGLQIAYEYSQEPDEDDATVPWSLPAAAFPTRHWEYPRFHALEAANRIGESLEAVDLSGAHVAYVKLPGAILDHAVLRRATLRHADLQCASCQQADLRRADLVGADLRYADLFLSDCSFAVMDSAKLDGANAMMATMHYASLQAASLRGANLVWAGLDCSNLSYADLTGAELEGARLLGVNLMRADLKGIQDWESIGDLTFTNLFEVRNAPPGFIEHALRNKGALYMHPGQWKLFRDTRLVALVGASGRQGGRRRTGGTGARYH